MIRSQLQTLKRDVRREWAVEEEHLGQVANQGNGQTPSQIAIRNEYLQRWLSEENSRVVRIVKMRLAGTCYTEIAGSLGIHQRTVRRIMQRLVKRLGAN